MVTQKKKIKFQLKLFFLSLVNDYTYNFIVFEMIPADLEFFGYGTASPDELRAVSQIRY